MPVGIGAMMAGGNATEIRERDGLYPTPDDVTEALFTAWEPRSRVVWEPACGDGRMARVIEGRGYFVSASDIADHGYGEAGVDFLTTERARAPCIITNPPFPLAFRFIEHAKRLGVHELALVLKSTYWHAANRAALFEAWKPSLIMPLQWRPDFLGLGRPTMEVQWCVWSSYQYGGPTYVPLRRPGSGKSRKRGRPGSETPPEVAA